MSNPEITAMQEEISPNTLGLNPAKVRHFITVKCCDDLSSFLNDIKLGKLCLSHDAVNFLLNTGEEPHLLVDLHFENGPAGANNLIIHAKPSERFKALFTATCTSNGEAG